MNVLHVGVLLLGPSGVGKSETAIELVSRGHKLAADDVVELHCAEGKLRGCAPELIRYHLEVRGLGILYLPDLFGPAAVCEESPVDLICRLEPWREEVDYERVGITRPRERWQGVDLPALVLPVRPAASLATLVEVAVRDHLHRMVRGSAAERLDARFPGAGPS